MAVQLQCFGKLLTSLAATFQFNSDNGAEALATEVFLCTLVPWAAGQSGVVDGLNSTLLLQERNNFVGVRPVTIHAKRQCFDSLQNVPRIERACRHSKVAQHLHACLNDVRTCTKRWPVCKAVVAGVWLGEVRETSASGEVELAAIDDCTSNCGAVTTEELCCRVNNNVCTPLKWANSVGSWHGVVKHQWNA